MPPKYKRVLLKISGEAFCKEGHSGIDIDEVQSIARQIKEAASIGTQIAIVVGGGNIIRNGVVTVNNAKAAGALDLIRSWVGTIAPRGVTSYQEEDARNAFDRLFKKT